MKKRLRAELYTSYLKMGKMGLRVDAQLWEVVRQKLASHELCGTHASVWTEPLPARAQEKLKRVKGARVSQRFLIDDTSIDAIVDEELPSARVWHRYLVRWKGYDPAWEAWRIPGRGSPGDPIESWEPATSLQGTAALERWEAANA